MAYGTDDARGNTFKYPSDVEERTYLKISAFEYSAPSVEERNYAGTGGSKGQNKTDKHGGPSVLDRHSELFTTKLYIPGGFGDQVGSSWASETIVFQNNPKKLDAQVLADQIKLKDKGGLVEALGVITNIAAQSLAGGMLNTLGDKAGGLRGSIESSTGTRIATNQAKIFKGNSGRDVQLSFTFSPKDANEAKSMVNIIDGFRTYSTAKLESASRQGIVFLYKYPPLWDLKLVRNGQRVKSGAFWEFKTMALTSFGVTYANNSPVFTYFHDGKPTDAQLQLSFESIFPASRAKNESGQFSGQGD